MKVLVAEDDVVQLRLLEVTLSKWGYHVLSARDGETAWQLLQNEDGPILAILDWMMPGYSGPQISRLIREQSARLYTYIILLTARKDKESIVEGMDAGADDYLAKPYILDELAARIRAGKRILHLQDELVKVQEALRDEAMRDPLTHLWNRRTIFDRLEAELTASRTTRKPVGVILVDLDHFKQINDNEGHLFGDHALLEAVKAMQSAMRPTDFIGRFGGEEFLMVIPGCGFDDTIRAAERIRVAVESVRLRKEDGFVRVTVSAGCTASIPGREDSLEAILRATDEALYESKRQGRNRVSALPMDLYTASLRGRDN
ncbi:MAG: diguanylate cyclase [Bryobacterales bacterium]|nr:diguanylate cyclase [Bryobacterales bacterium]